MDKEPLSLRFAKNVEENRQRLVQNCWDKGKYVARDSSLSTVVTINNTIEGSASEKSDVRLVRYMDIDGTVILEQEITPDEPVPIPTETPNVDPEFLEFVKWKYSDSVVEKDGALMSTQHVDVGPIYRVREQIEVDGVLVRPTILVCNFNEATGLSPTFYFYKKSSSTLYIDWGDGVVDAVTNTVSTGNKPHTYSVSGTYVIRVYGASSYSFYTSGNRYLLGSTTYNGALLHAYLGDNFETTIYSSTFYCCSSLSRVVIPENVSYLSSSYFQECVSLKVLVVPDSVTSISSGVFNGCRALKMLVLPNDMTSLPESTCNHCDSLSHIVVPSKIISIGTSCFAYCYSLSSFVLPDTVVTLGASVFSSTKALKTIIIPNSVTSIGSSLFSSSMVESVVFPENLTDIGGSAFYYCYSLRHVVLPAKLTSIQSQCFYSCSALSEVYVPQGVITIGDSAFNGCYNLEKLSAMKSVASVGSNAFSTCQSLKTLEFGSALNTIGGSACTNCYSLTSISIPNGSVVLATSSIFSSCTTLADITIGKGFNNNISFSGCWSLSDNSLITIARNIAVNTGNSVKTITIQKQFAPKLYSIFLNSVTEEPCESTDENAVNLMTFIQNKNWTVSVTG